MPPKIHPVKFEEGAAAYNRGVTVRGLAERVLANREVIQSGSGPEDWRDQESQEFSLVLGFFSGIVEDIRRGADRKTGIRA